MHETPPLRRRAARAIAAEAPIQVTLIPLFALVSAFAVLIEVLR